MVKNSKTNLKIPYYQISVKGNTLIIKPFTPWGKILKFSNLSNFGAPLDSNFRAFSIEPCESYKFKKSIQV